VIHRPHGIKVSISAARIFRQVQNVRRYEFSVYLERFMYDPSSAGRREAEHILQRAHEGEMAISIVVEIAFGARSWLVRTPKMLLP
jgi:hypothetical protein